MTSPGFIYPISLYLHGMMALLHEQ